LQNFAVSLSSKVKAMEAPSHRDETILMVEDDDLVRMSVQSLIESLGYRVVPARDGPDALEILRHDTRIDLLFTDIVMAGRNAWAAAGGRGAATATKTQSSLYIGLSGV
jgi:CheY-like chemotaxis protein